MSFIKDMVYTLTPPPRKAGNADVGLYPNLKYHVKDLLLPGVMSWIEKAVFSLGKAVAEVLVERNRSVIQLRNVENCDFNS